MIKKCLVRILSEFKILSFLRFDICKRTDKLLIKHFFRFRMLLIYFFSILIFIFGTLIYRELFTSISYVSTNSPVVLVVDKETTAKEFVEKLKNNKLIEQRSLLLTYIRLFGISKKLKAGTYLIREDESIFHLLKRIVAADVMQVPFQIIEGTTNAQTTIKLKNAKFLQYKEDDWLSSLTFAGDLLLFCAKDPIKFPKIYSQGPCVNALSKKLNLEGLFFADTYKYAADSSATLLLSMAHIRLKKYLLAAWESRKENLPYNNPYELLIAASIIEKESALPFERKLIASVIVNRLRKNMPLQMDPTVIYGLGDKYIGKLTHADLQIASDYNTYKKRGLPPTPIASVGKNAIDAASNPDDSDYLYYVANGNGIHVFSKTYKEQKQAIRDKIK